MCFIFFIKLSVSFQCLVIRTSDKEVHVMLEGVHCEEKRFVLSPVNFTKVKSLAGLTPTKSHDS